ncbi:HelD family protein [Streptomyces liangshanensis]|uniref:ATP-binding domain-containing protein n=1 Tax=Streptomyces liangshanensis TaxID=2717324 RepID=A0A6G9H1B7_9ACTN|nr:ATP-binding domain-containing protein [Streptomyces liangshanensis]QIQ04079.1 ATP-binding domain-containing protein [Streptomyces liangshanensis]
MTAPDPDLARALDRERTYHQTCRTALTGMVDDAAEQVVTGENAFASGADAEVLGRHLRSRAKELRLEPDSPLFFGRLDFDAAAGDHSRQSYHIGRRRISEHPSAPPLVVDWRAPVSRAFYRASASDPQGVAVRRRFGWAPWSKGEPEDLTGLEDEYFATEGEEGSGPVGGAAPSGAILAGEIERPRVGPMRDIAATIQPEQDELVRSELGRSVCVQGAPGTGKTAVGLHRAAYLLYTYPQRIQRAGLLILGPNRTFLAYISEVLPALGEIGVRQSTVRDEIARHAVRTEDSAEAAAVKHDARMAEVLRRALYGRVSAPVEPLTVPDGSYRWRLGVGELEGIVDAVRAEAPPYATGRERVRSRAVRALQLQAERRAGPRSARWVRQVSASRGVTAYLDRVWPKATPEEVLAGLLADPGVPGGPCDGVLDPAEQRAVHRPRRSVPSARTARTLPWSAADLVLLDELAGLIERPEGYAHVVIDEAQDLSPMECRAIARRAEFGSLTVLGDLAQGTTPWAARSWPELLAHLGRSEAAVVPLTVGFRVPGAVVELANRLLGALDVDVPPSRSLRSDGELTIRQVGGGGELLSAVVRAVRAALAREGSVGVIADGPEAARLRTALAAAGVATAAADELGATAARVTVLPASEAKGLEYDHVVLVEPAAIAGAEARGLHQLYVALTRAVSRLDIVHHLALPGELGA